MRPALLHVLAPSLAMLLVPLPACSGEPRAFTVTSPQFTAGGPLATAQVLKGFGCHGGNLSPGLVWSGAPAGTRSFAVTVHDPDAPTGSGWWHWVVYDLPASVNALPEGAGSAESKPLPSPAVQGVTDFGSPGYGGACPPSGDAPHRYRFTVHALKVDRLDVPPDATAAMVGYLLTMNRLGQATIEARFGR